MGLVTSERTLMKMRVVWGDSRPRLRKNASEESIKRRKEIEAAEAAEKEKMRFPFRIY